MTKEAPTSRRRRPVKLTSRIAKILGSLAVLAPLAAEVIRSIRKP